MAEKDKKKEIKIDKSDIRTNNMFKDLFNKATVNTYKNPQDNMNQIDNLETKINNVLNADLDELKEYGGSNVSSFLMNTLKDNNTRGLKNLTGNDDVDFESIFASKDGSVFAAFNERFRNKALLFHDLEIISEQLVEITEALNTTRDDIICADDIGAEISRSLNFTSDVSDREKYDDLIEEVMRIEKELKLNHKIREHIIPKTLKYGEYYVYIIPESKLYEKTQHEKIRKNTNSISLESTDISSLKEIFHDDKNKPYDDEVINEQLTSNIMVNNDDVALPLLESAGSMNAIMDLSKYTKISKELFSSKKTKKKNTSDTVFGFSDGVKSNKKEDFSSIKGCYIKLLDPKRVIPVKIMDYIIGYYYVSDREYETNIDSITHNCRTHKMNGSLLDSVVSRSQNERNIISSIANAIVKSLNKEYLEKNAEFKELIMNSLVYNDMYKRKLHYQFIPADNMCRFTVNEDEEGNGTSMIYRSLFYAKLYLSMLIFNMITYLSKSQDTRIHYVKNSGIDKNVINKCMNIARQIKSKQISIADLMDYSSIYGKIGTGRDVFMPVGESGERGIEFDVIAGQQVDMQPEFMEQLKQSFINATGVPSVIMNYINEADFAKTLVMANAKHMRRVMTYQDSFNESITRMYKLILLYCSDIEMSDIQDFEYKLQRPRSLPTGNLVDILGYGDQLLDFLDKAVYGQYNQDESLNVERDMFREELSRKTLPMLPWETVDDILERIKITSTKKKAENGDGTQGTDDNTSTDDGVGGW